MKWDLGAPLTPSAEGEPGGLDNILAAFRRRFWVFAAVLGAVVLLTAFATFTQTRLYTATADIQLDVRQNNILGRDVQEVFSGLPPDTPAVETETEIMRSRALAGRVVDALNLTQTGEFASGRGGGLLSNVRDFFRGGPRPETAQERRARREATINEVMGRTEVRRNGVTYIIQMSFTSRSPEQAARIANAFAENYITMQLESKFETIATANQWLATRLAALRVEVQQKEQRVADYRARMGLLGTGTTTFNQQSAEQINLDLVRAQSDLAAARARLAGAAAGASSQEALRSPVVAALRTQIGELASQRAELATRYGPLHPQMQQIDRQMRDLQGQVGGEIGRVTQNLRTEVEIAEQRVASLQQSLRGESSTMAQNNAALIHLRELERDAEASRALYEAFLTRYRQVAETSGIERADARIVSEATPPMGPSSPRVRINLMLGLLLGIGLGAAGVFIIEMLERSLRTAEDVQSRLKEVCVGAIPFVDRRARTIEGELLSPEDFIVKRPLSAFGEAMRSIRASVFYSNPDRKTRVVAVTSALPEEGKTTAAIGLARISALSGSKTILVDCDLRRRSATHCFGVEAEKGLTEVLFRTATLPEVIRRDAATGLDILPLAQAEFSPRDLFASDSMKQMLDSLRSRYEVIILDTAPVVPLSDTRVLAPLADAVIVVARWGRTPASIVRGAIEQIRAHGGKIAGVVLEGVETGLMSRLIYDKPDYYSELYQTYYVR